MLDLFGGYSEQSVEQGLIEKLEGYVSPEVELPHIRNFDKWIVSSALQKSLRRGYKESALNMARLFLHYDPDYIFRRLKVIAYEDIGIANPELIAEYMFISGKKSWRKNHGGDSKILFYFIDMMVTSPKDRNACEMLQVADLHPRYTNARELIGNLSISELSDVIRHKDENVYKRLIAAWVMVGTRKANAENIQSPHNNTDDFLPIFTDMRIPEEIIYTTRKGLGGDVYSIGLGMAFAHILANQNGEPQAIKQPVDNITIDIYPACAFDKHTRLGKRAIRRLIETHESLNSFMGMEELERYVGLCIFQIESAVVDNMLTYENCHEPLQLSTEAHLCNENFSPVQLEELLQATEEALPKLNQIRSDLYMKNQGIHTHTNLYP